jgi:hypothetical protein
MAIADVGHAYSAHFSPYPPKNQAFYSGHGVTKTMALNVSVLFRIECSSKKASIAWGKNVWI